MIPVLYLAPSKVSGVGVFTATPIYQGDHVIMCEPGDEAFVNEQATMHYPAATRRYVENYGVYMKGGRICVPKNPVRLSLCWYLNHSLNPNVHLSTDGNGMALRDIAAGDELVIDYRTLDPDVDNSLVPTPVS